MVFQPIFKNDHWYKHEFTLKDVGTWYDSNRGIYLVPDILIDAYDNGYSGNYDVLLDLHKNNPEVFADEYQDVRDVLLKDEWIYEEMDSLESWLNNEDNFLIPEGYYIGFNPDYGDFGLWEIGEDDL